MSQNKKQKISSNKLEIISEFFHPKFRRTFAKCKCNCGNILDVAKSSVTSGHTKSCGCLTRYGKRKSIIETSIKAVYKKYVDAAKKRNLTFNLTESECGKLFLSECHYCGTKSSNTYKPNKKHIFKYNGIDRKDNNIGYEINNCISCCKTCNFMKCSLSYNEFLSQIETIYILFKNILYEPPQEIENEF